MKRKMTLAFKMQAIRMYKGGMSARQVGAALSIDHCRVLTWVERFDHFGIQGISNRQPSIPLSTEEKLEIIRDIEKNKLPLREACMKYGGISQSRISAMLRLWRTGGAAAFTKTPRANKFPIPLIKSDMEEFSKIKAERDALREEVKDLRMQIDILKKVQALVLKEERKASRGKSASSKG